MVVGSASPAVMSTGMVGVVVCWREAVLVGSEDVLSERQANEANMNSGIVKMRSFRVALFGFLLMLNATP